MGPESRRGLNMDMLSTTVATGGLLVVPSASAWRRQSHVTLRVDPPQTEGPELANDSSRTSEGRRRVFVLAPGALVAARPDPPSQTGWRPPPLEGGCEQTANWMWLWEKHRLISGTLCVWVCVCVTVCLCVCVCSCGWGSIFSTCMAWVNYSVRTVGGVILEVAPAGVFDRWSNSASESDKHLSHKQK